MASGCLVISERLNDKTLIDLDMGRTIIPIESPLQLKRYQKEAHHAICKNTWDNKANIMKHKFQEICEK